MSNGTVGLVGGLRALTRRVGVFGLVGCLTAGALVAGCGTSMEPPNTVDLAAAGDLAMGCSDDKMCAGATPRCDVASHTCVACLMDSQCPEAQLCMAHKCVPGCSMGKGCGDAGMCDPKTGMCTWCGSDNDCPMDNPRCDGKTGRCVPCLPQNDNCPQGKYCVDLNGMFSCNAGCGNDSMCRGGDGGGALALACCKNVCIDTDSDNLNCGACGNACGMGMSCCSGRCVDLASNAANCSACGSACPGDNAMVACEMSKCVLKGCTPPFADCDKQVQNGCEVNTDTDPMNCTACGKGCSIANGKAGCNKGCTVGACDPGFDDCDKQVGNGCEISITTDVKNCGACGMACAMAPNANSSCSGGKCTIAACNGAFLDCDMNYASGCEVDGNTDVKNCGKCGTACPAITNGMPGCAGGACGIGSCSGTFRDCDSQAANGCEVDTSKDAKNCGACGKACPAVANGVAGCTAGVCGIGMCNAGFLDCNMNLNDGCETDSRVSVNNCGACGKVCLGNANNSPTCAAGVCGLIPCMAPFKECDNNAANGCETNTSNDIKNCGNCGMVCAVVANGQPGCAAGVCGVGVCNAPFKNCDNMAGNGCEVNGDTDVNNCGACANKCAAANGTPSCAMGVCAIGMCNVGFKDCKNGYADGCETNSTNDPSNCGSCGTKCAVANGVAGCAASVCTVASCNAGFGNCKNGYADGCETNTNTDLTNCGVCGKVCAAVANGVAGCAAGVCGIASCNAPFANCDNNAGNGCETDTTKDAANCGACGNVCANGTCYNGSCKEAVLIVGAPGTSTWNNDVKAKLDATGSFRAVDIVNGNMATPTLQTLKMYDAVLVFSDAMFQNAATLGDNLADYFDGGGRVVVAVFANASVAVAGRWANGGYQLIQPGGQKQPAQAAALQIVEAGPLTTGVTKLTATAGYASTGGTINGGTVVARWGDATTPLIVRGVKNGRALVGLNFYPPSSAVRADFWVGDGAIIMRNALQWHGFCHAIVGNNGGRCPTGKVEWCDAASPIVGTNAPQAKVACEACWGGTCNLENADCGGAAYGPKPAGQYVCGDAYFGYVAGCSGAAGRIWSICGSYTTFGRWAP